MKSQILRWLILNLENLKADNPKPRELVNMLADDEFTISTKALVKLCKEHSFALDGFFPVGRVKKADPLKGVQEAIDTLTQECIRLGSRVHDLEQTQWRLAQSASGLK